MFKMMGMLAVAVAASAAAAVPAEISFLPRPGVYPARELQVAAPAEDAALARRIAAAVQRNSAWFQAYVAEHSKGGEALPYHPNFGVSEAEYARMLSMAGRMILQEVSRVDLAVGTAADGSLTLSSSGRAARLNGITIHPEKDVVETPFGRLTHRVAIDQDDPNSPTGRWKGVQWSNEAQHGAAHVKLALGRRENGEGLIYFQVTPSEHPPVILAFRPG